MLTASNNHLKISTALVLCVKMQTKNILTFRIGSILNPLAGKFSGDTRKQGKGAKKK